MLNIIRRNTISPLGENLIFSRAFVSTSKLYSAKAAKFLKAQRRRQKNEEKQATIKNSLERVDPVFGKKNVPFIARISAELKEPLVLSSGYNVEEVEKFLAAIETTKKKQLADRGINVDMIVSENEKELEEKRQVILRILSMRNANNKSSIKLALKLAREEFQRFPGDTGSSEVQAACMTVRILNMAHHIQEHRKDYSNTRHLRMLVQQRQSILRYLKRNNAERYYWVIQKLGLTDTAVTEEFNMDRQYMKDYKFFESAAVN
ncbi:mitochondrial 37S ribosomal protein uS15m NDAI_0C04530 [Naumovozyma dairenensis CBS 421]|uniref:Ribosomal protein S15 n=1 Tax=Naumovozyma dairenensis (strain ATCC 10597 / BCRC 20456 / CBS 421 / NBRC 0211 / NRRL Y-12639) TaxID=1071378 RepID=G0W8K2_NAUDC|nr:hypothetical protein NDAI_0C04530 [Naumovozyma dairenensis CBS 421]CCD24113.1 hypothetical protein NDAI_0C04530 [Naumovozyma dairenensis CBS 421]